MGRNNYSFGLPIQTYHDKLVAALEAKKESKVRVLIPVREFHPDRVELVRRTFEVTDKLYTGVRRRSLRMSLGEQLFHEIILEDESKLHHVSDRLTDSCSLTASIVGGISTFVVENKETLIDKPKETVRMKNGYFDIGQEFGGCHG